MTSSWHKTLTDILKEEELDLASCFREDVETGLSSVGRDAVFRIMAVDGRRLAHEVTATFTKNGPVKCRVHVSVHLYRYTWASAEVDLEYPVREPVSLEDMVTSALANTYVTTGVSVEYPVNDVNSARMRAKEILEGLPLRPM